VIKESSGDQELNDMLVQYIQVILLRALNDKINEKSIIDKLTDLLTDKKLMDSVELSVTEVVTKEHFKEIVGTSAVDAVSIALKKKYPNSFGLLV